MTHETIRPPDMVGAGLTQQPQDPASLIGLLRSQGSLPADALQAMMGPQPSASPGASALLGGVAMMPGQTGAQQAVGLNQQNAQFQQRQQMEQAQMMERVRERKQAEEWKKTEYVDNIADGLIKTDEPESRMLGWQMRAKRASQFGVQGITPDLIQRLGRGKLSKETLDAAVLNAASGVSDEDNQRLHPGLSAQDLPFIHKLATSSDYRRKLGLRDDLDVEDHKIKLAKVEMESMKYDLMLRKQDETERRNLTSEQLQQRRLDIQERRNEQLAEQFAKRMDAKDAKQEKNLATFETALDNMDLLADNMNVKNFLTKDVQGKGALGGILTGNTQPAQAAANRHLYPYDEDLTRWKQLQATIIGFDRTVLNDIGARAFLAFKNQFQFFDEPPSAAAIHKVTEQMRQFITVAKSGKVPMVEHVYLRLPDGRKAEMDWKRGEPLPPGAVVIGVR